jgi:hypothetical protein
MSLMSAQALCGDDRCTGRANHRAFCDVPHMLTPFKTSVPDNQSWNFKWKRPDASVLPFDRGNANLEVYRHHALGCKLLRYIVQQHSFDDAPHRLRSGHSGLDLATHRRRQLRQFGLLKWRRHFRESCIGSKQHCRKCSGSDQSSRYVSHLNFLTRQSNLERPFFWTAFWLRPSKRSHSSVRGESPVAVRLGAFSRLLAQVEERLDNIDRHGEDDR